MALNGVRIVGAVYLGWLAFGTLRTARHAGFAGRAPLRDRQVLRRAVLTNLTNPKVILFFAAFLPQFERGGRGPSAPQMLVLGMMFLLVGLLVDSAVGLTVGRIGDAGAPGGRAATALGVAAGFTLGGLSVLLLAEALYDLVFG